MIRLFDDTGALLLGVLMGLRDNPEDKASIDRILRQRPATDVAGLPASLDELIQTLEKQLHQSQTQERDLIDVIVKQLGLPYAENRVGKKLAALRSVLLNPDELASYRDSLQQEAACTLCGGRLDSGQIATIEFGRGGGRVVLCTNCEAPKHVTCRAGKHPVDLPVAVTRILQKVKKSPCKQCEEEAKKGETAGPEVAQESVAGRQGHVALDLDAIMPAEPRWVIPGPPPLNAPSPAPAPRVGHDADFVRRSREALARGESWQWNATQGRYLAYGPGHVLIGWVDVDGRYHGDLPEDGIGHDLRQVANALLDMAPGRDEHDPR